jgi:hypothetical protein
MKIRLGKKPKLFAQSATVDEAEAGAAGEQPARNSQLETPQDDGRGRGGKVAPFHLVAHRIDRFPDALKNSLASLTLKPNRSEPLNPPNG